MAWISSFPAHIRGHAGWLRIVWLDLADARRDHTAPPGLGGKTPHRATSSQPGTAMPPARAASAAPRGASASVTNQVPLHASSTAGGSGGSPSHSPPHASDRPVTRAGAAVMGGIPTAAACGGE
jgi:hypothetical protein